MHHQKQCPVTSGRSITYALAIFLINKKGLRLRLIDNVNEDNESIGLTLRGVIHLTKDRKQWRSFIHTHSCQMAGIRKLMSMMMMMVIIKGFGF